MANSNFFAALAGAVLSGLFESTRQPTPRYYPVNKSDAAEKTAALTKLFESKAFIDALPSAQEKMIDAVSRVYNE